LGKFLDRWWPVLLADRSPLAAYLTIPGFMDIIKASSSGVLGTTFLMGLLWGIGGLTYGLGVRYLGVSLGSSIILGIVFCIWGIGAGDIL
jgi:hypothetical protein